MTFRTWAAAMAVAIGLASTPAVAQNATPKSYSSLTVFGDSLVDAGNIFAVTGGATPSAAAGYFNGRFTNGYDYTDLLSIAFYGRPTVASVRGGSNYAYGGARILDTGDSIPDLGLQLKSYEARLGAGGKADANGLYILNMGGNDIFGVDRGSIGTATSADQYLRDAAATYAASVQELNNIGARNIIITGFPVIDSATSRTAELYLTAALAGLKLDAGTQLMRFDYLDFFTRVSTNPGAFGLPPLDRTTTCQQARAFPDCTGYASFDGTHPTAAIQRALYEDISRQFNLAAVPEPGTWMLMILGFGLVGVALRRQPRRAAVA